MNAFYLNSVMSFVGHEYPRPTRKERPSKENDGAEEDGLDISPTVEVDEFNEY